MLGIGIIRTLGLNSSKNFPPFYQNLNEDGGIEAADAVSDARIFDAGHSAVDPRCCKG